LLLEDARTSGLTSKVIKTKEGGKYDSGGSWMPGNGILSVRLSTTDYNDIQADISAGQKIPAIKKLRSITNWGLKESKDAVEDFNNFRQAY
jgi:hypothetical protein